MILKVALFFCYLAFPTNILKFYSHFADVVVLARELNLDQIESICNQIAKEKIKGPGGDLIRIELFAHGALCMAVSGKCYLSLHENNYSANRGMCLQTCRKGYTVTEKESGHQLDIANEYIMSPKDLCTIHFLNKILPELLYKLFCRFADRYHD